MRVSFLVGVRVLLTPLRGDGLAAAVLLEGGVDHGRADAVEPCPLVVRPRNWF